MALILVTLAKAQDYAFPSTAEDYAEFYPTAYVDHGGTTDWACSDLTYSGHHGSDFGGGSWSGMEEGRDVAAAAPGVVVATNDGEADDCSTGDCDGGGGFGNYVKLQHADGKYTYYGHMKTWSVLVAVGDTVACGQKLGEMGSSGHSTGPHVHFEVRDSAGSSGDPFYGACSGAPSWWVDQGEWSGLPALVCDDVEPCASLGDLACGTSISTSNDTSGSTTTHGVYGCGEYTYSGPEVAYTFATDRDEAVTLSLTGNSADVDLFVLSADTCDGSGALGCSISPDADAESITFTAAAGVRYTVVADGYEGATTGFMLSAACAGAWPATSDTGTSSEDSAGLDTPVPSGGKTVEPDWVRLDDVGCGGSAAWFPFVLMGGARRVRRGRTTPSAPRRGGRGA